MSINKQNGTAAIFLVFLLIPLFGSVFLALEGTRYIQKKGRLADATEAASLAIAIANRGGKSDYEKELTTKYIQSYIRNIETIPEISISMINSVKGPSYNQYTVEATTEHKSWFSSLLIPSFNSEVLVKNKAVARFSPEVIGSRYVDIIFVSDFSGSMNSYLDDSRSGLRKIEILKNAVMDISKMILESKNNKNIGGHKIGFVPFSVRTQTNTPRGRLCTTQLSYTKDYEEINWRKYAPLPLNDVKDIMTVCESDNSDWDPGITCPTEWTSEKRDVIKWFFKGRHMLYPDALDYVDIAKTVENLFIDKVNENVNLHPYTPWEDGALFNPNFLCNKRQKFYTIPMTSKQADLNKIEDMEPSGGTSVYQGIIQGAQLLHQEKNSYKTDEEKKAYADRVKILLILSDGTENPYVDTLALLVKKGLCKKIKSNFPGLYMAVLGIGYKPEGTTADAFNRCVGVDNIIGDVTNLNAEIQKMIIKAGSKKGGSVRQRYRNL